MKNSTKLHIDFPQLNLKQAMLVGVIALPLINCGSGGSNKSSSLDPLNPTSSSTSSSTGSSTSSSTSSSSGGQEITCLEEALDSGYCLVWNDEFNSTAVDETKWSYERNCWGGGNNEAQCYVDSAENVWVDGEYLYIKAIREDVTGPAVHDGDANYDPTDTSGSGTYTSGRLRTIEKGDWKYGRIEARVQLPEGQGTWPAVWMLPTDWEYGGWPLSGEIDIMEAVNLKVGGEDRVHGTLHYGAAWPNNVSSGVEYTLPGDANPADDFHVYAIEWEEGEIRWFVDGDHYATQTAPGWYTEANEGVNAPFDQRFHLLINFAVGGNWAANVNDTGIDESVFPQELIVDYVRVYQCTTNPDTGVGCGTSDDEFTFNEGNTPPEEAQISGNPFVIYEGGSINSPFGWGTYTTGGTVGYANVDSGDPDYGEVAEITFNTNEGIGFFQSDATVDLSEYTNIEFDLRVTVDPRATTTGLTFRADCVYPCTSGDVSIDEPELNVWTHYTMALADLAASGLDVTRVNTPVVISPLWGNQAGVVIQIDNVTLTQ